MYYIHFHQMRIRVPTLALKPRGDVTRCPKQGYQWPHKKDLCPPKISRKQHVSRNIVVDLPFLRKHKASLMCTREYVCSLTVSVFTYDQWGPTLNKQPPHILTSFSACYSRCLVLLAQTSGTSFTGLGEDRFTSDDSKCEGDRTSFTRLLEGRFTSDDSECKEKKLFEGQFTLDDTNAEAIEVVSWHVGGSVYNQLLVPISRIMLH